MTASIQAELPEQLLVQAQALVHDGWASDINEILADALGRYLESHSPAEINSILEPTERLAA